MAVRGKFIVFEGGEGSGKTRHSERLVERLRAAGQDVLATHEPGGSGIGSMIRQIILHENKETVQPRAELFLFLADRAQHVAEVIEPAIAAGRTVVCDRFSGSTFAYQVGGRALPNGAIVEEMDRYARGGLTPDLVVYLDIDPETGLQRKRDGREAMNRMDREELAFHERVRRHFLEQARQLHWVTVSTAGEKEAVAEEVWNAVKQRLSL